MNTFFEFQRPRTRLTMILVGTDPLRYTNFLQFSQTFFIDLWYSMYQEMNSETVLIRAMNTSFLEPIW